MRFLGRARPVFPELSVNRTIEAIVRLSAKLGPMAAFGQMGAKLSDVNRKASAFNKTQALVARGSDAATAAMLRFAAPAAIAYGAQRAVREFAGVERTLTRIGINADASREQMADVFKDLQQIAQATRTPVDNIVSGLDSLIASGKSLDEAMALIGSVSATAQAAGANFGEMATTADAISNSFGIAGEEMQNAFDILAKGGKAGKFELRDMAAELPSLAPAFAALGYEGEGGLKRLTAALQTVRMETGTSGEAATSFMDVLTKMNSVTVSNSFKKQFGVDLRREMLKAKRAGEDTLEAFIRLSKEAVNGDMSKLPLLFTDKQMLIGMRALMNHTGEFRDLLKELGSAAGTVGVDLKRVLDDSQGSIDGLANSWDRLKTSLGETIAPPAASVMDAVSGSLDRASAVNAGLEKTGKAKGWWARTGWGITSSEAEKDSMAWAGGYRTEEQRAAIAGYGAYAKSRASAPAFSMPRKTLPDVGPVVRTRDGGVIGATAPAAVPVPLDPTDVAISRSDAERGYSLSAGSASVPRPDNVSVRPGQGVSDLQGLLAKLEAAGEQSGVDLAEGGGDAADAIARAAPEAGNGFGDAAAARINASAAEAGAAFGDAAAARIRALAGTVRHAGSGVGASGNMGRSMPAAGTNPGGS
jgi:TP901 family phage tail tape measure protein